MRRYIFFLTALGLTFAHSLTGKIIRISDGDTIVVETSNGKKLKIRIFGIDTPEKFYTEKLYKEAKKCNVSPELIHYLGKLASKHAHLYLHISENVKIVPLGKGFYGREIAKVILPNGKDFGFLMVKDGYACVYWKNTTKKYIKALHKAEKQKKGLWKINFETMKCLCSF